MPISTSLFQTKRRLTVVSIEKGVGNLSKHSVALCHQVTTLDRAKFEKFIGTVPPEVMAEIEEGLKTAMDII